MVLVHRMKKITLNQIGPKGYTMEITPKESWVIEVFHNVFPNHKFEKETIEGTIQLTQHEKNVSFSGHIQFSHHPLCAKCGNPFKQDEKMEFQLILTPLDELEISQDSQDGEDGEIELEGEELDFSFYENDEILVDSVLNDEIVLQLPYNYYCHNQSQCHISIPNDPHILIEDNTDQRWQPLKDLKILKS